jgi:uncharacterized protein
MNGSFTSENLRLACHVALPPGRSGQVPGLVMCHGFPTGPIDARLSAGTFPELMDRIANTLGFAAMTFTFRGCGESAGDFSLRGWFADLQNAVAHLRSLVDIGPIWLAGNSTGGSLCMGVAAADPTVSGVAALAPRSDFDDWANQPRRFLEHAREIGAIRHPGFPPRFDQWARELRWVRPVEAAKAIADRPLLLLHGDDDDTVPARESRLIANAHGSAELRILNGAGHRLRHDPRAVAVLLGWLDRQRNEITVS